MKDYKKPKLDLSKIAEIAPEWAEIASEVQAKHAAGLIEYEYPRRTYRECRSWREAWVYIFGRVFLEHSYHLKSEDGKITCVVWPVRDFDDKIVAVLEKIANRIGVNNDVNDMRLIGTRVTPSGIEKLKNILPKARIECYSREEAKADPKLEYVNTNIGWIKKLYDGSEKNQS